MLPRCGLLASRTHPSRFAFRALVMVTALLACSGSASDSVAPAANAPAEVAITPSTPAIPLGSQLALQAQVRDASGQLVTGAAIFWSSSDTTVVTVSPTGVLTGKRLGTAQVAASSGGQSAVVAVVVVPVPVASVAVLPSAATLVIGGTAALQAVQYDANGIALTGRSVVWATSDARIATVNASGLVMGVAAGSATVTGTSEGKTASATITVTLPPVAAVTVSPGSATLAAGETASFSAVATDANGNSLPARPITWTSTNTAVATVSSLGLVTAVATGTATITASAEGKIGVADVIVTAPRPAPVATVHVSPAALSLQNGQSATLIAQVFDAHGNQLSGRVISWSSSSANSVSVTQIGASAASVTAARTGSGTVTITATSEGVTGSAAVSVTRN